MPLEDDPLLQFEPYFHPAPRGNSITPERQRGFIAALAASGIVTQAARSIGVSLEALYKLRRLRGAEGFAAAWEAALERGVERLEDCALELALQGEELPIASGGHLLGTYRKHNFGHIRFVLSQRRAARYGKNGAGGGRIDLAALSPEDPAYRKLREQWQEEYEAERRRQALARYDANEAFLHKLNARLGAVRQKAIDAGLMKVLPGGRGEWVDPELRGKRADEADSET
jgi:hypothetical protein